MCFGVQGGEGENKERKKKFKMREAIWKERVWNVLEVFGIGGYDTYSLGHFAGRNRLREIS